MLIRCSDGKVIKHTSCTKYPNNKEEWEKLKEEVRKFKMSNKVTATITAESVEQLQLLVGYMCNSGEQADCFAEENIKFNYNYETGDIEISTYKD